MKSVRERFDEKWVPEPNTGCWLWTAGLDRGRYGVFEGAGHSRTRKAHRWAWVLYRGPIPEGMYLDHICRTRCCVNPDHLRAVTPYMSVTENSVNHVAAQAKQTHCLRGHPLSGTNLLPWSFPRRRCRECYEFRRRKYEIRAKTVRLASKGG
mgnify:CR=1 FL=1